MGDVIKKNLDWPGCGSSHAVADDDNLLSKVNREYAELCGVSPYKAPEQHPQIQSRQVLALIKVLSNE